MKGVQTLVIPAGINLLRAAFAKRDMNVDRRGLTDAVESPDALLEKFWIRRQIEEHEVVGELEISPLAADL